jgi:flavin-dependent thymidylate synthase
VRVLLTNSTECRVTLVQATEDGLNLLCRVLNQSIKGKDSSVERVLRVARQGHTNFLEFINFTFNVENISMTCLAQLRTHRIASYMASSHHYSNVEPTCVLGKRPPDEVVEALTTLYQAYTQYDTAEWSKEERRLWLPASQCYSVYLGINLRSFINLCNLRRCKRNCNEIKIVVDKLCQEVLKKYPFFSELLQMRCATCKEGIMSCKKEGP